MATDHVLGALAGLGSGLLLYALYLPYASSHGNPFQRTAARVLSRAPRSAAARWGGLALTLAYGAMWGVAMGAWNLRYFPITGNYVAQGILWGLAAFLVSLVGFLWAGAVEDPLRKPHAGLLLVNHIAYGASLGVVFYLADLTPAGPV